MCVYYHTQNHSYETTDVAWHSLSEKLPTENRRMKEKLIHISACFESAPIGLFYSVLHSVIIQSTCTSPFVKFSKRSLSLVCVVIVVDPRVKKYHASNKVGMWSSKSWNQRLSSPPEWSVFCCDVGRVRTTLELGLVMRNPCPEVLLFCPFLKFSYNTKQKEFSCLGHTCTLWWLWLSETNFYCSLSAHEIHKWKTLLCPLCLQTFKADSNYKHTLGLINENLIQPLPLVDQAARFHGTQEFMSSIQSVCWFWRFHSSDEKW